MFGVRWWSVYIITVSVSDDQLTERNSMRNRLFVCTLVVRGDHAAKEGVV